MQGLVVGLTAIPTGARSQPLHFPPVYFPAEQSVPSKDDQSARETKSKVGDKQLSNKELAERLGLNIPVRPLSVENSRLTTQITEVEKLPERNDNHGPFVDENDYLKRAIFHVPTDVKKISVAGHEAQIVMRTEYAQQLSGDIVPSMLRRRIKPANVPALLDEMPDSSYIRRVSLDDRANTLDEWLTTHNNGEGFVSDMSLCNGELTMYRYDASTYLRRDILHEWSHAFRYQYYEDDLAWRFGDAVDLEGWQWNWRKYGSRSKGENWAVLGEPLLGINGEEFLEAADKAPIRTVIWMRGLEKCFADRKGNKSVNHAQYMARMRYVQEAVTPKAVQKLQSIISTQTDWRHDSAIRILNYIQRSSSA